MMENFLLAVASLKDVILFVAMIAALAYVSVKILSPCPTGLFCRLVDCDPFDEDDYMAYELGYNAGWIEGYEKGCDTGFFEGWDEAVELETGLESAA